MSCVLSNLVAVVRKKANYRVDKGMLRVNFKVNLEFSLGDCYFGARILFSSSLVVQKTYHSFRLYYRYFESDEMTIVLLLLGSFS